MGDLFDRLKSRVDDNARRAVDAYASELPEYRSAAFSGPGRAALMDFAVLLRRRTAELAADDRAFSGDDLEFIVAAGRERGERGLSLAAQRGVLVLHSTLTLREVQEAAGPMDNGNLMRMLGWLGRQGDLAGNAFTRGFLEGQERFLPAATRVRLLADMLLADDTAAPELARSLGMPVAERYAVTVVRVTGEPGRPYDAPREKVVGLLVTAHGVPMTWHRPEEFVVLVPDASTGAPARDHALSVAREFAEMVGRPCAVGTATGAVSALAETLTLGRQISMAAPIEAVPSRTHSLTDVFVELGAAGLPAVDRWLRDVAARLAGGPALVATLAAYYRSDMNRQLTAAALHVHPRTLDYRLRRVRELTGIEPGSTHGVRVLSTTVTRMLAGAWPE